MLTTKTEIAGPAAQSLAVSRHSMREQADDMLAECHILDILAKHGDVRVFGSYELDLIVWAVGERRDAARS